MHSQRQNCWGRHARARRTICLNRVRKQNAGIAGFFKSSLGAGFSLVKKEWLQDEKLEHGKQVYLPTAESTQD